MATFRYSPVLIFLPFLEFVEEILLLLPLYAFTTPSFFIFMDYVDIAEVNVFS